MDNDQYQMGRTKIFVKNPESVINDPYGVAGTPPISVSSRFSETNGVRKLGCLSVALPAGGNEGEEV